MKYKNLSLFIREQFPRFILENDSMLPYFMEAYYEWLGLEGNPVDVIYSTGSLSNLDESFEKFRDEFISEYIDTIPEELLIDRVSLIKKVSDFYKAKGTNKAIKFLLRILFSIEVEVIDPSQYIFKSSDSIYVRDIAIRFSIDEGILTSPSNVQIKLTISDGRVYNILATQIFRLSGVTNQFEAKIDINYDLNIDSNLTAIVETNSFRGTLLKNTSKVEILDGGNGFVMGEIFGVSGGTGSGLKIKIKKVDKTKVKSLEIIDFGVGYDTDFTTTIGNLIIKFNLGYVYKKRGVHISTTGFTSDNSYLHDGKYYQQYSYLIKSTKQIIDYKNVILDNTHVAGTKLFLEYLIENEIDLNVDIDSIISFFSLLLNDNVTFSEQLTKIITKPRTDQVTISEVVSKTITKYIIDTLNITDKLSVVRYSTEGVGFSEVVSKHIQKNPTETIRAVENGLIWGDYFQYGDVPYWQHGYSENERTF